MVDRHLTLLACCALGLACAGASEVPLGHPDFHPSPERPVGWRGDGSGVFPGATPVAEWDGTTGHNIVWSVAMPQFATSTPLIVGDKVITTANPHTVLCYAIADGERLWYNAADSVLVACEGDEVEAEKIRELYQIYLTQVATEANKKKPLEEIAKEHPEVLQLQAVGAELGNRGWGKRSWDSSPDFFRGYGLAPQAYSNAIGRTFPTPICDGTHVYLITGMNTAACYALDSGVVEWLRFFGEVPSDSKVRSERMTASPVLADGVLVARQGMFIRGLDAKTGKTRWTIDLEQQQAPYEAHDQLVRRDGRQGHCGCGSLIRMEVGGQNVVVTPEGQVIRPTDGRILCPYIGAMANVGGHTPVCDDANDVVFMFDYQNGGKGVATDKTWAVRLTAPAPDRIEGEVLWSTDAISNTGGSPLFWQGILFSKNLDAVDPATGEPLSLDIPKIHSGSYSSPTAVGPCLITGRKGAFSVIAADPTARKFRTIAENKLFTAFGKRDRAANKAIRSEQRERALAARQEGVIGFVGRMPGHGGWTTTYGSSPFFAGNRFVIRTRTHLYCIGDPKAPYNGSPTR